MHKKDFINAEEEDRIISAIRTAEKNTSGEIRVHIEDHCDTAVSERVKYVFQKLGMHETKQRNAVLFYVSANNRSFYIYGDKGIYKKVPDHFWEETIELMQNFFKKKDFAEGLVQGILKTGEELKRYFPYERDDINELPDEISRG